MPKYDTRLGMLARPALRAVAFALVLVLLGGCGAPVGVRRADPERVHRMLTANVLTSSQLSTPTLNVLHRRGLYVQWQEDSEGAIAALHEAFAAGKGGRDDLSALAELSFAFADATGRRSYYLAAVIYAYAFLFPEPGHREPDPLDPRLRLAADLYNRGLTEGFASPDGKEVELRGGLYGLPFGTLAVAFDPNSVRWGERRLERFIPVADLQVTGMETRYRWAGIGAPLAASTVPWDPANPVPDFVAEWAKVPVTAILLIDDPRKQIVAGYVQGALDLIATTGPSTIDIGDRKVPLEIESTASLAYTMAEAPIWQQEIAGFLASVGVLNPKPRLAALSPYKPGRIPVVLVHGTVSSEGRWADMLNELENDPRIADRYQFWLFHYDTGNPVPYSAMLLRNALTASVKQLDPEGKDPTLKQMVVMGHSQGGLLTKMTAIDSGDVLWDTISKQPLSRLTLSEGSRKLLQEALFVKPLPFVRRVIFIATPHRGSYVAGSWIAHQAARLITLPTDMLHLGTDLMTNRDALATTQFNGAVTSVDSMTPNRPFIKAIQTIPVAPGIVSYSIIPVAQEGTPTDGNDGVVEYQSAHIDGVESEFVVHAGHSCQSNPLVIEEVRRILLAALENP